MPGSALITELLPGDDSHRWMRALLQTGAWVAAAGSIPPVTLALCLPRVEFAGLLVASGACLHAAQSPVSSDWRARLGELVGQRIAYSCSGRNPYVYWEGILSESNQSNPETVRIKGAKNSPACQWRLDDLVMIQPDPERDGQELANVDQGKNAFRDEHSTRLRSVLPESAVGKLCAWWLQVTVVGTQGRLAVEMNEPFPWKGGTPAACTFSDLLRPEGYVADSAIMRLLSAKDLTWKSARGIVIIEGSRRYPWLERCLDEGHLGPTPSNPTNAGTIPILLDPASRTKGCSPPENAPNEEEELYDWPQDPENYRTAFESQKHLIEQLGNQILRLLHPSKLHRWTGPHRSGSNIDLKSAFRAEADTRSMELVWRRCLQATLSDASITLLVDVSGSMHGQRIESTLIATVLLAEVCHRVGIPLSIFTFSDECRALLRAGEPLDARIQGRLGGITQAAGDGTHLTAALEKVERAILNAGDPNAHVVVLSDGKPTDDIDPKWILRRMGDSGIQVLGLGLGPDSNGLKDHIAHAKTNLEPHQVAEAFVELLNRMAEDAHHPDFRCD